MKKIIAVLMLAVLTFSLSGCKTGENKALDEQVKKYEDKAAAEKKKAAEDKESMEEVSEQPADSKDETAEDKQ